MRRMVGYLLVGLGGILIGSVGGAVVVARLNDEYRGNFFVHRLLEQAYAAREIYAGRSLQLANSLRAELPRDVLHVEEEFREDKARNTAFRVVSEVYALSNTEVPIEIRSILASVPPRPSPCPTPGRGR